MRTFLLKLMGAWEEPPTGDKCAWRYKVEEYIKNNITIPEDERQCEECNGYPVEKGCMKYTTLSHLKQYYDLFSKMKDVEESGGLEDGVS